MKDFASIRDEVYALIADELSIPVDTLTEESAIADLSPDSIRLFELLLAFEKKYKLETTYEDVVNMHTIRDVIDYLSVKHYAV